MRQARVEHALAALLIVFCGCVLGACGGTTATGVADPVAPRATIRLTAPATTTIPHARIGDTVICRSRGEAVRAKIPPPGQLNKGVGHASRNGSSQSAELQMTSHVGSHAVVVSCEP